MDQCRYYERPEEGKCVTICPQFPPERFDEVTTTCIACAALSDATKFVVVENECICSPGHEPDVGEGICQLCQGDSFKPTAGNIACQNCRVYEVANGKRTACFNKCSQEGLVVVEYYDLDDGECYLCPPNMVVEDNLCRCAEGFELSAGIAEIGCVRSEIPSNTRQQSEKAFIAIISVIVILHVAIGIHCCVYRCMKGREFRLRGIKSA